MDLCRADTCLAYANVSVGLWTMVDGELFLQEAWLGGDSAQLGEELAIPEEHQF